jgi:hypothetical protein
MQITSNSVLFEEMFGNGEVAFSVVSNRTGDRKTFQVTRAKDRDNGGLGWFVSQLTGPDNRLSYTYLLMLTVRWKGDVPTMRLTAKSPTSGFEHEGVKAFRWLFNNAIEETNTLHQAAVWRACNCRRCGKLLTVPESIEAGIGPVCGNRE